MTREAALHELDFEASGFEWIDCHDWQNSLLAFVRRAADPEDFLVVCCNFTPVPRTGHRLGVPRAGTYDEIFNGDAALYGGSNIGNAGVLHTESRPQHGRDHSLSLVVPPLATIVLKPRAPHP